MRQLSMPYEIPCLGMQLMREALDKLLTLRARLRPTNKHKQHDNFLTPRTNRKAATVRCRFYDNPSLTLVVTSRTAMRQRDSQMLRPLIALTRQRAPLASGAKS